jgi:hypothetical protein
VTSDDLAVKILEEEGDKITFDTRSNLALTNFQISFAGIQLVDSYTRQVVQHYAFLCLVSSDTPARYALLEHVAVGAFLGCGKCWMEGCKYEGCGHGTYSAGYARPAPQPVLGGGQGILAKDSQNRTHQEHVRHGTAAEKGLETKEKSGVKRVCCIAKVLPYFNVVKGFPIAVGHAFLLGVVSAFLNAVLTDYKTEGERPAHVITKADQRVMSERHAKLVWTHEHGRPAKDVVKYRASMTMEELLVFVETASPYVLLGCLPKELETAWFHLRRAVMHYCRISEAGMDAARRERAKADMAKYASIVEEVSH